MSSYLKIVSSICIYFFFLSCNNDEAILPPEAKNIELLFPKGGEFFTTNDTIPIIWENNTSELVKIEFSADLGKQWIKITDSLLSNNTIYFWKLPNLISSNCIIKITALSDFDSLAVPFRINVPDYKLKFLNYYPLKIGNLWIYKSANPGSQDTYLYSTIVGDTLINQKFYFKIENEIDNDIYYTYEMVDTLTGNVFQYQFNQERVIDNLYAEVGDTIDCRRYGSDDYTLFESEEITNLWETKRIIRTYFNDGFPIRARYSLIHGIGLFASNRYIHIMGFVSDTLLACRVQGIIYGDTTLIR